MQTADSQPGVSIVIPAYNYAHYLPLTLASVLRQNYPNFEILVVDDGSTDNTRDVVAGYGNQVRYVYQKNGGLSAARNTGIKNANFDYIGFIDADDEWQPTLISHVMGVFRRLPDEFAIVACQHGYIDAKSNPLKFKSIVPSEEKEFTCRDFILMTRVTSSSSIIRRKAFATCGVFDETLSSSEDRDMWIRIASKYRIYRTDQQLSLVRRHSHNMSKHGDRMKRNTRRVLQKAWDARLVAHSDCCFWTRVFSFYFYQNYWRYRSEGSKFKALRDLTYSFLCWPYFPAPEQLNEPPLFRLRTLIRFVSEMARFRK